MLENIAIERYKEGQKIFKEPNNKECIKVYDENLSGINTIDINLQAIVLTGAYRKFDFGITSGANLWAIALETNIITFRQDSFPIFKDKNTDEIQQIVFDKWKDILHMAIEGKKGIRIDTKGINELYSLSDELNSFKNMIKDLEAEGISSMPCYYRTRVNDSPKQDGQIELKDVFKDLINYENDLKLLK